MMKKKFLPFIYVVSILFAFCLSNNKIFAQPGSGPKFEFLAKNNRIEIDTIFLDWIEDVKLDVEFMNKGDKPLIVKNVSGCCGTQISDWTKKPVFPEDKGAITVEFRVPPRPHKISRTIKVVTNDPAGTKTLHIVGVVAEPIEEGTITLQKKKS